MNATGIKILKYFVYFLKSLMNSVMNMVEEVNVWFCCRSRTDEILLGSCANVVLMTSVKIYIGICVVGVNLKTCD